MPHKRKPKSNSRTAKQTGGSTAPVLKPQKQGGAVPKRISNVSASGTVNNKDKAKTSEKSEKEQPVTKRQRVEIESNVDSDYYQDTEGEEPVAKPINSIVASIKGERIQLQTKVSRLVNNMNRPSVLIKLDAKQFTEMFQRIWDEHIPGFTGLRGSKRERTEKEKQMEWRTRVAQLKEKKQSGTTPKKNGQTVSEQERNFAIERYRALKAAKLGQKATSV